VACGPSWLAPFLFFNFAKTRARLATTIFSWRLLHLPPGWWRLPSKDANIAKDMELGNLGGLDPEDDLSDGEWGEV